MILWTCSQIQFARVLLTIFASVLTRESGLSFCLLLSPCPVLYQCNVSFIKWAQQSPFLVCRIVWGALVSAHLKRRWNSAVTLSGPRVLLVGVFKFFIINFYMYVCFACLYVYVSHVCTSPGVLEWASAPLRLELQMVVSYHVGTGNWTGPSRRPRQPVLSPEAAL